MADQNNAGTGAKDEGTTEEQNPFSGFQSEGFQHGERIEEPKKEEPAAAKPETKPAAAKPEAKKEEPAGDDPDDGEGDPGDENDDGKSRRKPAAERIGELTRLRRDAERRAEAAERRLAEIEGRGDGADDRAKPEAKPAAKPEAKKAAADGAPNPDDEKYTFGEIDPQYIRDLARYEAREAAREAREEEALTRKQEQEIEHQRAVQKKFEDQIETGRTKYPDYDEVVIEGAENNDWLLSRELAEMIVESAAGADIAYHLASHPEEAAQVYRQTPLEQARYFGKMEAKFSAEQTAAAGDEPEESAKPKLPKAPQPPETPRGRGGRSTTSPDTSDFAAFEKMAMGRK